MAEPRRSRGDSKNRIFHWGLAIDGKKVYGDGDLIIHFDITDPWKEEGGLTALLADPATNRLFEDDYDTGIKFIYDRLLKESQTS